MRTTISLEDRLAAQVRREAAAKGVSVSAFIAATLDDAIKRRAPPPPAAPAGGGGRGDGPRPGIDLDRPRTIETADDEAGFRQWGS